MPAPAVVDICDLCQGRAPERKGCTLSLLQMRVNEDGRQVSVDITEPAVVGSG